MNRSLFRQGIVISLSLTITVVIGGIAYAQWSSSSQSDTTHSSAASMPAGAKPTVAASGSTLTLGWAAAQLLNKPVEGYLVTRYNKDGSAATPATGGCSGIVRNTTCVETAVPAGDWRYTIIPRVGLWAGVESQRSDEISVSTTTTTLTDRPAPPTITPVGLTTPTNATTASFTATSTTTGATFHYKLDTATTYSPCTNGSITVSGLSAGEHHLWVTATDTKGAVSDATEYRWTVDLTAPTAHDVQATHKVGGPTMGKIESGDQLALTYSEPILPSSIMPASIVPAWDGKQPIAVTLQFSNNNTSGNDSIAIYSQNGQSQISTLGTVNLNQSEYVSQDVNISAIMSIEGKVITITIGQINPPEESLGTVTTPGTMSWHPTGGTDLAGNALTTTGLPINEKPTTSGNNPDVEF